MASNKVIVKDSFGIDRKYNTPKELYLMGEDGDEILYSQGGGGGDPTEGKLCVRFIDYDGTILKTDYIENGQSTTAPELPDYSEADHENSRPALTFQEWNNDFTNITHDMDMGTIWIPSDEKTYIYFTGIGNTIELYVEKNCNIWVSWNDDIIVGNDEIVKLEDTGIGNCWIAFNSIEPITFQLDNKAIPNIHAVYVGKNFDIDNTAAPFYKQDQLETVTFHNTITKLWDNSFTECKRLKAIILPRSIISLGYSCFYECALLEIVSLAKSSNIEIMFSDIFKYCLALTKIILPDSIKNIDSGAFGMCESLKYVYLNNGLEEIGDGSFYQCKSLKSIDIPNTVKTILSYAFAESSIEVFNVPVNLDIFEYGILNGTPIKTLIFPENIKSIQDMSQVPMLREVEIIGATTASIPLDTLNKLTFSKTLVNASFYMNASFPERQSYSLTELYFMGTINDWLNINFMSGTNPLLTKVRNVYIDGMHLKNLSLPDNLTEIPGFVFTGSVNLIKIPDTVQHIGESAFAYNSAFVELKLPRALQTIDLYAFRGCEHLEKLEILENVTHIYADAFNECNLLKTIIAVPATPPTMSTSGVFGGVSYPDGKKIYVSDVSLAAYKTATNWSVYSSIIYPLSDLPNYIGYYDQEESGVFEVKAAYDVDLEEDDSDIIIAIT